jgi:ubiquinone/menaquinone biosynthesis C-methylase UbiE
MGGADIPGAIRGSPPWPISPEAFDEEHAATGRSEVIWRLAAEAYGEDYPAEVRPWGLTTWWVLGRCVSALRVGTGQAFVDLACGRGGPGLWLSRATGADLIGVDWSPVAIKDATERTTAFVPSVRARFLVGDLAASGLPDECADAAVCLDAIFFAEDRVAALREVRRLLRPAGRYAFTGPETDAPTRPGHVEDWRPLLEAAGLEVESKEEVPRFAEQLGRMYDLWLERIDEIRAELGAAAAEGLETEARTVAPTLASRRSVFITARRPR